TVCGGTLTPAWVASTSTCGVMPLSAIHSYNARSRYGRWLVIACGASLMREVYRLPAAPEPPALRRQLAQALLLGRQAAHETGVAEDTVAVILDRLAVLGQRYPQRVQAPDDRRHGAVGQAHFGVEEELAGLAQRYRSGQQFL